MAIQSRGQEGVGLSVTDFDKVRSLTATGTVQESLPSEKINELTGPAGVGGVSTRGINGYVGETQLVLLTAGGQVKAGQHTYTHDASFAAISRTGCWDYLYLQEGTSLRSGDRQIIATGSDKPRTVALWRGENQDIHLTMTDSLVPHTEPLAPDQVKLQVFSSRPISRAFCDGQQLPIKAEANIYTIGK